MNKQVQAPLSAQERLNCEEIIADLVKGCNGIVSCVVASVDGFVIAEINQEGNRGSRLAAMSSSTTALANAITGELQLGKLNTVVVDADMGKVVVISASTSKQDLALLCVCNDNALMGQVLFSAKSTVKKIASMLKN